MTEKDFKDGQFQGSVETRLDNIDIAIERLSIKMDKMQQDFTKFNIFKEKVVWAVGAASSIITIVFAFVLQLVSKIIIK